VIRLPTRSDKFIKMSMKSSARHTKTFVAPRHVGTARWQHERNHRELLQSEQARRHLIKEHLAFVRARADRWGPWIACGGAMNLKDGRILKMADSCPPHIFYVPADPHPGPCKEAAGERGRHHVLSGPARGG
jgi:hypothetical protein